MRLRPRPMFIIRLPLVAPVYGPNITFLNPLTGSVGQLVRIIGTGFGATQGSSTITMNGINMVVSSWSDVLIQATIPTTSTGYIVINKSGQITSALFTVTGAPPATFDFYLSTTGNDAWNGLFPTFQGGSNGPVATFHKGMQLCQTAFNTNSITKSLGVRGGNYPQLIDNPSGVIGGNSWNAKIRIANFNNEVVWLNGTGSNDLIHITGSGQHYIEFDGINCDAKNVPNTPVLFGSQNGTLPHHIRIMNCEVKSLITKSSGGGAIVLGAHVVQNSPGGHEVINVNIHDAPGYGVYVSGPNMLVDRCDIHHMRNISGIQIYNGGGDSADNNIITRTKIHDITTTQWSGSPDNRWAGVICIGNNNLIANCLFYGIDITAWCIANGLTPNGTNKCGPGLNGNNNRAIGNTMVNSNMRGMMVDAGSGNLVRNNIMYNNTGQEFEDDGIGTIEDHNSRDGTNPQFVNPASDFHLTNLTPASIINAGLFQSGQYTSVDFDGIARGNPCDIGAYEKV